MLSIAHGPCDQERWFCADFRKVNDLTIKDSYPLPRIDDSIDALRGSQWFSAIDLVSGYWQVPMHPDDIHKTAITTPFGLYNFKVMPFGLENAPATFEHMMERVLAGLHWKTCLIYIDDIIVFSHTFEVHLVRLHQVLTRLKETKLKMSPTKCNLFQRLSTWGISCQVRVWQLIRRKSRQFLSGPDLGMRKR